MLSMSNVKGSSHDLFQGTTLECIWRDWGKILKSVSMAGGLHTEIEPGTFQIWTARGFHHMNSTVIRQTIVLSSPLTESCTGEFMFYDTVPYFLLFCLWQEFCTSKPGASTTTSEDWETEGGVGPIFVHSNSFWLLGKKDCCDKQ
jgi:hypothetical protein